MLSNETLSTTEKSSALQKAYEKLRSALMTEIDLWSEASREELDGSLDVVDKYIFGKCFSHVYQPADKDDALQDRLFVERSQLLSNGVDLKVLTGDETLAGPDDEILKWTENALKQTSLVESPSAKLDNLMAMVKHVAESGNEASADLLIPLLVLLVIKAAPPTLISDMRYIQRFRDHQRLTGEAAYSLTNIVVILIAPLIRHIDCRCDDHRKAVR